MIPSHQFKPWIPILARCIRGAWLGNVRGLRHLPSQRCIIVANHASYLDFLLLGYVLRYHAKRKFVFWAKPKIVRHRFWKFFAKAPQCIEVGAKKSVSNILSETQKCLNDDFDICIFPEGKRTRSGELNAFHKGYLIAARNAAAPIVPVFIEGTFSAWPFYKRLPISRRCDVTIHPPIYLSLEKNSSILSKQNSHLFDSYSKWKREESSPSNVVPQNT